MFKFNLWKVYRPIRPSGNWLLVFRDGQLLMGRNSAELPASILGIEDGKSWRVVRLVSENIITIGARNAPPSRSRRASQAREARTRSITARAKLWPADYQGKEFHGWSIIVSLDGRRVEIRSKKGGKFHAIAAGRLFSGNTRAQVMGAVVLGLNPDAERIVDSKGRVIA